MQAVLSVVFLITGAIVVVGFAYLLAPRLVPARRSAIGFAVVAAAAFFIGVMLAPRSALNDGGASPAQPALQPPAAADASAACLALTGTKVSGPAAGSLDAVSASPSGQLMSGTSLSASDSIAFAGWAISSNKAFLARAVCVEVDGRIAPSVSADYGIARPDVANALSNAALVQSGFEIKFAVSTLAKGAHSIAVAVVDADGSSRTLGTPRLVGVI